MMPCIFPPESQQDPRDAAEAERLTGEAPTTLLPAAAAPAQHRAEKPEERNMNTDYLKLLRYSKCIKSYCDILNVLKAYKTGQGDGTARLVRVRRLREQEQHPWKLGCF